MLGLKLGFDQGRRFNRRLTVCEDATGRWSTRTERRLDAHFGVLACTTPFDSVCLYGCFLAVRTTRHVCFLSVESRRSSPFNLKMPLNARFPNLLKPYRFTLDIGLCLASWNKNIQKILK